MFNIYKSTLDIDLYSTYSVLLQLSFIVFLALTVVYQNINFTKSLFSLNLIYASLIVTSTSILYVNKDNLVYSYYLAENVLFFNILGFYIKPLCILIDQTSLVFTVTTLLISIGSNYYTNTYLKGDKNRKFFTSLLNLFIFSMLFLVNTNSLIVIVFCWEFLGISSFFLINFYSKRAFSIKSAFKAFSFNRFSDVFMFIFFLSYYYSTNSTEIYHFSNYSSSDISLLCPLSLTLAASIKSAQNIFFF